MSFVPFCTGTSTDQVLVKKIQSSQIGGGGGIIPLCKRNGTMCVMVVYEISKNLWTLPCGKHDTYETLGETIAAEAYEELGFHMGLAKNTPGDIEKCPLVKLGKGKGTVLALMFLNADFSRLIVSHQMQKNSKNLLLPSSYREVGGLELVEVSEILKCLGGQSAIVPNLVGSSGEKIKHIQISSMCVDAIHAISGYNYRSL